MKILQLLLPILIAVFVFACQNGPKTPDKAAESSTEQPTLAERIPVTQPSSVEPETNATSAEPTTAPTMEELPAPSEKKPVAVKMEKPKTNPTKSLEVKNTTTSLPTVKTKPSKEKKQIEPIKKEERPTKSEPEEKEPIVVPPTKEVEATPTKPSSPSHSDWDQFLRKQVSPSGKVNYRAIVADQGALDAYLEKLASNPLQDHWTRNEKMAYWINAYNAFTIKLIVDNYPLKSITSLDGGKPWDRKWIVLGDKTYSLNQIENDILRPQFKEPGIHFAVNCAAMSCPPLLNRAWTADNLTANFKKQAIAFINNPAYNQLSTKAVKLSKIFDWYKADFGDLIAYLNRYADNEIKADAKVSFLEYDWELNE